MRALVTIRSAGGGSLRSEARREQKRGEHSESSGVRRAAERDVRAAWEDGQVQVPGIRVQMTTVPHACTPVPFANSWRESRETCVQLDAFDVACRDVVDVEVRHVQPVEIIRRRTIGAAPEAKRHAAHDVRGREDRTGNRARHLAQDERVPRLDLCARDEMSEADLPAFLEAVELPRVVPPCPSRRRSAAVPRRP